MADKISQFLPYEIDGFDAASKTISLAKTTAPGAKIQATTASNVERLIFTGVNSTVDLHLTNYSGSTLLEGVIPAWFLKNNVGGVVNCLFRSSPSGVVIADDVRIVP
ncbi:hypothetical protein [Pseudomonas sp. efr-133-TYG-5]|uniref:hypothetical protein n=1 Tax=Pseudomonas sp. efr-133-TYG-5 TaxID=3040310 RepID=UPI00255656CE|nr:hypothetical protein [Pseudomonas sp. efr-133-TYG-5]